MDGRIKPDVVAPGHNIISVLNSFYLKNGEGREAGVAKVNPLKAHSSEHYGREYGMWSMSGQPVLRTVCTDGTMTLPNLPAGVYAVQIEQKGSTLIRL